MEHDLADVVIYVRDMAGELATMCEQNRLPKIAALLDGAHAEAAQSLRELNAAADAAAALSRSA